MSCKISSKAPFPQPLVTRQSYKQDVPQPPLPKISRKFRKCRRKPIDLAIEKKKQTTSSSISVGIQVDLNSFESDSSIIALGKRKASDSETSVDKAKILKLDSSLSDDDEDDDSLSLPEALASPVKHLIPQREYAYDTCAVVEVEPKDLEDDNIMLSSRSGNTFFEHINNFQKHLYDCGDLAVDPNDDMIILSECDFKIPDAVIATGSSSKRKSRNPKSVKSNHHTSKLTNNCFKDLEEESSKPNEKTFKRSTRLKRTPTRFINASDSSNELDNVSKADRMSPSVRFNTRQGSKDLVQPLEIRNVLNSRDHNKLTKLSAPRLEITTEAKVTDNSKQSKRLKKGFQSMDNKNSHVIYVTRCKNKYGITFARGDVVWGKLRGYPWWPCRIMKLIATKVDGESMQQEALVAWFDFKSTSILPLHSLQQFKENFAIR